MTWLTDNLKVFIDENPNMSVRWYATSFGCSEPTVRKVLNNGSPKCKPPARGERYNNWIRQIESLIVQNEKCTDEWESWFDWKDMYHRGLTPVQALQETKIILKEII